MAFGDSGSCNAFKKSRQSMIAYCVRWLQRPMGRFQDHVHAGWDVTDWVEAFERHKDEIAPQEKVNNYSTEALASVGYGSVRSDAPMLHQAAASENLWLGKGHLPPTMCSFSSTR